jgi:hypothetical protein
MKLKHLVNSEVTLAPFFPHNDNKDLLARALAPTSKFFSILRNIGLIMAALGGAIVTAPVVLPTLVITIAGYLTVAGAVISAVSQVTVEGE